MGDEGELLKGIEESEQGVNKCLGVKVLQILRGFSHSDQPDWNFQGVANGHDDAAARSAIQFGEGDSGHADRLVELLWRRWLFHLQPPFASKGLMM